MHTRKSSSVDKDKNFYTLFDWGNNKRSIPTEPATESAEDQITGTEQIETQAESLERADCEEPIILVKSEDTNHKTSEGKVPFKYPPFTPTEENSDRPISPISKEVEVNNPSCVGLDGSGVDAQDYSAFLDDIDYYSILCKTKP